MLIRRSKSPGNRFVQVSGWEVGRDLFALAWGPTVAALSYILDSPEEGERGKEWRVGSEVVRSAVEGFR